MQSPDRLGRSAYRLYLWAWEGLDWLYPPRCGGCGGLGQRWCLECQRGTVGLPEQVCIRCGQTTANSLCAKCRDCPPPYEAARSWAVYGGALRKAIHRLKYSGDMSLGEILSRFLISMYKSLRWQVDLIVPVPISSHRRAQRGYNQAALLAMPLALGVGVDYRPQAIEKVRDTPTQVGLDGTQRRKNVAGAFEARSDIVLGKRVLIVDDVMTSGATLETCSLALLKAGACQVYGLTLGRVAYAPGLDTGL